MSLKMPPVWGVVVEAALALETPPVDGSVVETALGLETPPVDELFAGDSAWFGDAAC